MNKLQFKSKKPVNASVAEQSLKIQENKLSKIL